MFRRLIGPADSEPVDDIPTTGMMLHKVVADPQTLLAVVAAMLYTKEDTPTSAVDRAAALIREVMSR